MDTEMRVKNVQRLAREHRRDAKGCRELGVGYVPCRPELAEQCRFEGDEHDLRADALEFWLLHGCPPHMRTVLAPPTGVPVDHLTGQGGRG